MQLIALISPSKPLRPHIPLFIIPSDRLIVKFFVPTVKPIYECPLLANLGMPSMELFYSGIDINNFSITIRTPLLIMIIYLNGFMRQSIVLTFINTHYQHRFLIFRPSTFLNSFILFVTKIIFMLKAWAAIIKSMAKVILSFIFFLGLCRNFREFQCYTDKFYLLKPRRTEEIIDYQI